MKRRNPIARAVRQLRPKVKPDKRRKVREKINEKERKEANG